MGVCFSLYSVSCPSIKHTFTFLFLFFFLFSLSQIFNFTISHAFQISPNSIPLPFNCKLCAGSTSQLTRHCLGSRPPSSLLITNEPVPASRFLLRLPVPPHLCHLLSPALSLLLLLPLPLSLFSTLFRHTLASFVARSV